eukprot:g1772.t1
MSSLKIRGSIKLCTDSYLCKRRMTWCGTVDGVEIDLTGLEGVIISNITSYAGGAYLWGANNPLLEASLQLAGHADDQLLQERKRSARFKTPSFNDGLLEVVGIRNSLHMIQIQVGLTRAIRLGQGKEVLLETAKPTLVQVDGEPWHQQAGVAIRVTHQNQALMLARSAASAEEKSEADQQVLDGVVSVLQWASKDWASQLVPLWDIMNLALRTEP